MKILRYNKQFCTAIVVFVTSQFYYCLLVWMCHSKTLNNRKRARFSSKNSISRQKFKLLRIIAEGQNCLCPYEKFTIFSYGVKG